jgi:hypothetical protein
VSVEKYIHENASDNCEVVIASAPAQSRGAARRVGRARQRRRITRKLGICIRSGLHAGAVESAFILLKLGVSGTWQRISAKHLSDHCSEMCSASRTVGIRAFSARLS